MTRFAQNYISVFDEKLIQQQKEFIYRTLPEMDFHVKRLKVYGKTLTGKELKEYILYKLKHTFIILVINYLSIISVLFYHIKLLK